MIIALWLLVLCLFILNGLCFRQLQSLAECVKVLAKEAGFELK